MMVAVLVAIINLMIIMIREALFFVVHFQSTRRRWFLLVAAIGGAA